MIREMILIFVGGGLGSVTRFSVSQWIGTLHHHNFPYGTLFVNIIACLLVGFVIGLADQKQIISPQVRLFWTVGFCGGFSTFSTFSSETLSLLQRGLYVSTLLYIIGSLVICLLATYGGLYMGESIN